MASDPSHVTAGGGGGTAQQQPASSSSSQTTTQLDFSQAMTDFKVMFPDMDAEVIEAVLRSNNGAVDATIDHLLTMSADNEAQKSHELAGATAAAPASPHAKASEVAAILKAGGTRHSAVKPPSYRQATQSGGGGDPDVDDLIHLGAASSPPPFGTLDTGEASKPPLDLLSDLHLGPSGAEARTSLAYSHPEHQAAEKETSNIVPTQAQLQEKYEENLRLREEAKNSQQRTQFLEDERVALMLQNEEFMAELRRDHEFMSALAMDDHPAASPAALPASSKASASSKVMDEAVFREKLKNMGKTSKRKFAQMASMFSRRKGAKQLLGHAPAPSKDNLLLNAEPLVNEDSDEEEGGTKHNKGKYHSFS